MILTSLSKAIREQNYYAVVLEFLIVIAGVVIGFQINAWNEARAEEAAERRALGRLLEETERAVAYWEAAAENAARNNNNRRILVEALNQGAAEVSEEPALQDALLRLGHYPSIRAPRAVLDELVATGAFSRISDEALRTAVSAYTAELAYIDGQLVQFRTSHLKVETAFEGRVFSVYDAEAASLRRFDYDLAALSQDRQFVSHILDLVRNQLQFEYYYRGALEQTDALCTRLAIALNETCATSSEIVDDERTRRGVNE